MNPMVTEKKEWNINWTKRSLPIEQNILHDGKDSRRHFAARVVLVRLDNIMGHKKNEVKGLELLWRLVEEVFKRLRDLEGLE